jgi:hypothetical protein
MRAMQPGPGRAGDRLSVSRSAGAGDRQRLRNGIAPPRPPAPGQGAAGGRGHRVMEIAGNGAGLAGPGRTGRTGPRRPAVVACDPGRPRPRAGRPRRRQGHSVAAGRPRGSRPGPAGPLFRPDGRPAGPGPACRRRQPWRPRAGLLLFPGAGPGVPREPAHLCRGSSCPPSAGTCWTGWPFTVSWPGTCGCACGLSMAVYLGRLVLMAVSLV